ncbi:sensor histidine kinase [Nocardioides dubius]|uniref:Oxygen sensor histidine kinase NreB n=1 Tax=Nocardioides dubius TaxID=317019 RepID=A0ABP4EL86_9ACTN
MARPPRRLGPRGQRAFDVALAAALALPAVLVFPFGAMTWPENLLSLAMTVPLLWRRTHPVAVMAVVSLAHFLQLQLTDLPIYGQIGFPFAVYAIARHATAFWSWVGLGISQLGAVLASIDWLLGFDSLDLRNFVAYLVPLSLVGLVSWLFGNLARTRHEYVAALLDRGERLEREADQQVALAAADERARIAREMHDVVAHGLSVIVVQADGARYAVSDPVATETLTTIAATGRESLTEMRRMLGLLRSEESGVRPQPVLADVVHLIAEARAGGVAVEAELPDPLPPVSDGVGLSVYRIVQEALTNVRKHAGPAARVNVSLAVSAEQVTLAVLDDGNGASAADDGRGLGLLGMRERTGAHGGTLAAGPRPGGGFAVSARIPL